MDVFYPNLDQQKILSFPVEKPKPTVTTQLAPKVAVDLVKIFLLNMSTKEDVFSAEQAAELKQRVGRLFVGTATYKDLADAIYVTGQEEQSFVHEESRDALPVSLLRISRGA